MSMRYVAIRDTLYVWQWRVEALDDQGRKHLAEFSGPTCEQDAKDYADWMNQKHDPDPCPPA